jgi:hypothetical protein
MSVVVVGKVMDFSANSILDPGFFAGIEYTGILTGNIHFSATGPTA